MTYSQKYYRSHRQQILEMQKRKGAERYLRKIGAEATFPFLRELRRKYELVYEAMRRTLGTREHQIWIAQERKLNALEIVVLRRLLKNMHA